MYQISHDHPTIEKMERDGYLSDETEYCSRCGETGNWWNKHTVLCDECAREEAMEYIESLDLESLCNIAGIEAI